MITGELKSKVDRIWDTMWSGGIANPLSVIEQLDLPPINETSPVVELEYRLVETGGKRSEMGRRRYTAEQIIGMLREAEVGVAEGKRVGEIVRELGIAEQTYYRWRREYGGMQVSQARRLKELERENTRLRHAVADLTLDNVILKEAARGNF